ncbi:MAG: NIPSNAP family protein [Cyclobacteriaceae bacterium]|nr:NIPSNAP family protein [Cyclobacteriaceae bacterium]
MKRRKFVTAAAASSLVSPLAFGATRSQMEDDHEIYDLSTYELTFASNRQALLDYLNQTKAPFVKKKGARSFMMFMEVGDPEPTRLWTLTTYPDLVSYHHVIASPAQAQLQAQSEAYAKAGQTYNRISSSLCYAFEGLKQMKDPIANAQLFELRIYEGVNEDAVHRKIKMFNQEELDLFYRVDLNPIFFGRMVVGPYIPSLVYMLNFRDMDHREAAWKDFLAHPEWDNMKVKPEYARTVSNIRRIFLKPL